MYVCICEWVCSSERYHCLLLNKINALYCKNYLSEEEEEEEAKKGGWFKFLFRDWLLENDGDDIYLHNWYAALIISSFACLRKMKKKGIYTYSTSIHTAINTVNITIIIKQPNINITECERKKRSKSWSFIDTVAGLLACSLACLLADSTLRLQINTFSRSVTLSTKKLFR